MMYWIAPLIALSISCFTLNVFGNPLSRHFNQHPYFPRIILWGLEGSASQARGDILFPITNSCDSLFFVNLQGEYNERQEWYAGFGSGYRQVFNNNSIYGGYLFLDRNESKKNNHYWVLSPGLEALYCFWDFRGNGYIPVSKKRKPGSPFFLTGLNDCGNNNNCEFVEFSGHQQFAHRFVEIEEASSGADLEVGYKFPCLNNLHVHAGPYYYYFKDINDIKGVEARLELPFGNAVLTTEASYDNHYHGKILAGLEFRFGQSRCGCCGNDIRRRLYDRVARNVGTVSRGTSVPIVKKIQDQGLFLLRDNIYFFTSIDGTVFNGVTTGTFTNPLAADQFNQATLDALAVIAPNANLYFTPGTYTILPGPNSRISIHEGQSLYGRTFGYRCSAVGNERALFVGGFDLVEGNNTLDSIRLLNEANEVTGVGSDIIALDIENALGVDICNSEIAAVANVIGDLTTGNTNSATGIHANNSEVEINNSQIIANAIVTGSLELFSTNMAVGIGGTAFNLRVINTFNNNEFTIRDTQISARAEVEQNSNAAGNLAVGIGGVAGAADLTTVINNRFNLNVFSLFDTSVNATALIDGSMLARAVVGSFIESDNISVGIGAAGLHTNSGTNDFDNNSFLLVHSLVSSNALIGTTNDQSLNFATGIGDNSGFRGTETFDNNFFVLKNSGVSSLALITGDNSGTLVQTGINTSVGIGDESFLGSSATFNNNIFRLISTSVASTALVGTNNSFARNISIGIGADSFGPLSSAIFNNNDFIINDMTLTANAIVLLNNINASANRAIGIGIDTTGTSVFENNNFLINESLLNVLALIQGDNLLSANSALGLYAGNFTTITIQSSIVNVSAIVNGIQGGTNTANSTDTAALGVINSINTVFNVVQQP